ncbi:hypothetical protein [Streptomyces sp. NPDC018693]|uniref:hypothetical protein n=1 Tax=unclassified Streptomyces TaxID=2593676 RepID=UPI00378EDE61
MGTTLQNWLFAMGGVLIASLAAAAKDWLGAKLKLLLDSLYGRFAGSRLLRRAALKKYTRELYRRHREFPVSFQVAEALRLPMESVYVPPARRRRGPRSHPPGRGPAPDGPAAHRRSAGPDSCRLGRPPAARRLQQSPGTQERPRPDHHGRPVPPRSSSTPTSAPWTAGAYVVGVARALYVWGILVEKRMRALTHPVRTLVLDALRRSPRSGMPQRRRSPHG